MSAVRGRSGINADVSPLSMILVQARGGGPLWFCYFRTAFFSDNL